VHAWLSVSKSSRSHFLRFDSLFFSAFCGWALHPTAKVSEGTNRNLPARNTVVQLLALYTNRESHTAHHYRQTDARMDGRQDDANSRSHGVAVRSAKNWPGKKKWRLACKKIHSRICGSSSSSGPSRASNIFVSWVTRFRLVRGMTPLRRCPSLPSTTPSQIISTQSGTYLS